MSTGNSTFLYKGETFACKESDAIFLKLNLDIEVEEYDCFYIIQNDMLCLYSFSFCSKLKNYPKLNNLAPLICDGRAIYNRVESFLNYTGNIKLFIEFMQFNSDTKKLSSYEKGFNLHFINGTFKKSEEYLIEIEDDELEE